MLSSDYKILLYLKIMKVGASSDGNLTWRVAFILSVVGVYSDFLHNHY